MPPCRKVGDPFESDTQHGPQINAKQLDKIQAYVDAVSGVLLGGDP
jgi:acyl-CoA reductase-like NAD-dependent aldehyde dehydrogenase